MNPVLIETSDVLEQYCETLLKQPLLAVDTEFFRETSYFPHLGLVQLAAADTIACVDPLAFDARPGLARLLLNPAITKVFHACIQDLEVLYQYLGDIPCPLADTQLAAAMLGAQDQVGYARLVEERFGVRLEKSQTRTNWLKRPLSSQQVKYAAEDVHHLLPMYEQLLAELQAKDRVSWLEEDCTRLCEDVERFYPDMRNCWRRVKGASQLDGLDSSVCYSVAQWREQRAMQKDMTRRRVMSDELLLKIVKQKPDSPYALKQIAPLAKTLDTEAFESLLEAVHQGLNRPASEWPAQQRYIPDNREKKLIKRLLDSLRSRAHQAGIAPGIVCARRDIEKLVGGKRDIQLLKGWRYQAFGKELLDQIDA